MTVKTGVPGVEAVPPSSEGEGGVGAGGVPSVDPPGTAGNGEGEAGGKRAGGGTGRRMGAGHLDIGARLLLVWCRIWGHTGRTGGDLPVRKGGREGAEGGEQGPAGGSWERSRGRPTRRGLRPCWAGAREFFSACRRSEDRPCWALCRQRSFSRSEGPVCGWGRSRFPCRSRVASTEGSLGGRRRSRRTGTCAGAADGRCRGIRGVPVSVSEERVEAAGEVAETGGGLEAGGRGTRSTPRSQKVRRGSEANKSL